MAVQIHINLRLFLFNVVFFRCKSRRFYGLESRSRKTFRHKDVSMTHEQVETAIFNDLVFVFDGHVEHHQVNVGIAIPADGENAVFIRSEGFDYSHWTVTCRERVSRTVIERVAQQENLVAVELFKERECLPCCQGRTVNVGEN